MYTVCVYGLGEIHKGHAQNRRSLIQPTHAQANSCSTFDEQFHPARRGDLVSSEPHRSQDTERDTWMNNLGSDTMTRQRLASLRRPELAASPLLKFSEVELWHDRDPGFKFLTWLRFTGDTKVRENFISLSLPNPIYGTFLRKYRYLLFWVFLRSSPSLRFTA